ncbi:MAG: hypothetical protein PVI21_04425 [Candidatus Woesebacteria bacterium]
MNSNNQPKKTSELEKFKIFYEHTDDSRTIVDKQSRKVKQPQRHVASRG